LEVTPQKPSVKVAQKFFGQVWEKPSVKVAQKFFGQVWENWKNSFAPQENYLLLHLWL